MTNEQIVALNREFSFFPWSAQKGLNPIPVDRAEGVHVWDAEGKRYLDFSSQLMNVNIGHSHPRVVAAIKEQADHLLYAAPAFATQARGELARMLAEIAPGDLKKAFFTLGGAEAVENAIKIARQVTKRSKIVTRYRSYHGATYGAISAGGDPRRLPVEPGIPGIVRVFDPYCYRCVFGQEPETCHRECITHVEQVIQFEGPESIAAVLMEGVTGTSGLFVPPDDYWPRIRQICDKYDILLIADEVMSGFGRTGKWFAINHWNIVPDMITMAKGITSGYLPLGAVLVSERISEFFEENTFWGGLTYSGHPMSCAAGVATLRVYREDRLLENTRQMAQVMAQGMADLQARHPTLGDARGIGLFWIIELVKDKETREPLVPWNATASERGPIEQVAGYLRERGVYAFCKWNWIYAVPPLCINADEIAEGLEAIDGALAVADATLPSRPRSTGGRGN